MARRSLGRPKKPKLSTKAGLARKAFEEQKHRRDPVGKFADKPGAGDDAPRRGRRNETKFAEQGVTGAHAIRVIGGGRRYTAGMTVDDYVASVGGDRTTALRRLARDMRAGRIGFEAPTAKASIPEIKKGKVQLTKKTSTSQDFQGLTPEGGLSRNEVAAWNNVVGVDPKEFRAAILRDFPPGSVLTVHPSYYSRFTHRRSRRPSKTLQENEIKFRVSVRDVEGGPELASASRTITKTNDGLMVHHDVFVVNSARQGSGLAKTLLRNSADVYESIGVARIDVHANIDVGGYAWAKYGFKPTTGSWPPSKGFTSVGLKGAIYQRLQALEVDDTTRGQVQALLDSDDPRALWAIADIRTPVRTSEASNASEIGRVMATNVANRSIGMADVPVPEPVFAELPLGKQLLLGTGWSGELSLQDADSVTRLRAYVGGTA